MKILVLGGTGAMGIHLVSLLAESSENEIYVTSRKERESRGNIHYIQGDGHNSSFIENLLAANFDVIIDFMAYVTEEFSCRYEKFLDNVGQYVFLSSSRVYADSEKPITENSPRLLDASDDEEYLATDEYALSKARQEDLLFNSHNKNWTVIRPYITYAENRLQLGILEKENWLFRALGGKTIVFSRDIAERRTTLTYGRDVARGIASIIGEQNALGEAFHITQPKSLKWGEIWDIYKPEIEKYIGTGPKILFSDMEVFSGLFPHSKYQIKYDRLFNREFDSSKIARFVDVSKFTAPEVGLKECVGKFIENGKQFLSCSYSLEGRADRITHEFCMPWKIHGGIKNMARYYARRMGV